MRFLTVFLVILTWAVPCDAQLRILGEESPPGLYLDAQGNPAGVTVDLVKDLLQRQGKTAVIQLLPWKRAYLMGLHEDNVALMETTRTEEREDLFQWVGPILIVKRIIYGLPEYAQELRSIDDVRHAGRICVLRGSSNENFLLAQGLVNIESVTRPHQCLSMLQVGRVDLFYTSEIGISGLLQEADMSSGSVKAILNLKQEYLYLAFSKDIEKQEITSWQRALEEAKSDGTLAKLYHGVYTDATIMEISQPGDPLSR